jgi:type I restriction enzyme, S subunit
MKSFSHKEKKVGSYKQTELGRTPKDWEVKDLLVVTTFLNGKAYNQSELLSSGKYKVLRVGNFFTNGDYSDLELDDYKYVEDDDLMYAWSASFGLRFWRGERTIYHYHIWKVIPSKLVTKDYLYFQLVYDTEKIFNNKPGATIFHITQGDMEKRKILIPPLPEQQKIARVLSAWDKAIEKTEQLIAQKQQLKKGLMQQLLTGKVRFKEFVRSKKMKKTKLRMIPDDWKIVRFDEFAPLQRGFDLPSTELRERKFPVVYSNGIMNYHSEYKAQSSRSSYGKIWYYWQSNLC